MVYKKENFAKKTIHIGHGMLRLPEGKMSSRTGDVISAESLLKGLEEKALDIMAEREMDDRQKIAEEISLSAFKYGILKQGIGKDIIFDFNKAVSFEGDSGPYLQYTAVRARSVLNIAKNKNLINQANLAVQPPKGGQTLKIEKILYRFPEIVERAWQERAPQLVVKFLLDLAGEFNSFYANEKIAEAGGEYKILVTEGVLNTLKNGLYLLGIRVPEKM